jgi:ABC-type nitrate/sulfonate/bicarbonate transport system substrate-binding protein
MTLIDFAQNRIPSDFRFSPPRRGRGRVGVQLRPTLTPILTPSTLLRTGFHRRGGRNSESDRRRIAQLLNVIVITTFLLSGAVHANPYLPKVGEAPIPARVGTCSITGGVIHFYTALFNGLFDKYGIKLEHVTLRGGVVSLAALSADEIQFIYCSADAMIPRMAAGADAKLIGSAIVGLPWVLMGRKDIKRPEDLKGKTIAVARPGGLTDQLAKSVMKKFNLTTQDVKLLHIGGTGQVEPYNAMVQGLTQATLLTPPLDVRARRDGFVLIYKLSDLDVPSIYSSMFTNLKGLKDRPFLVQRFVAAMAEGIYFVEKNPDKGKAALSKILSVNDQEVLQSAYDAYAKSMVNRRLIVPVNAVTQAVEMAREEGTLIRKKPAEIIDNSFAEQLDKSGFLKELWGKQL